MTLWINKAWPGVGDCFWHRTRLGSWRARCGRMTLDGDRPVADLESWELCDQCWPDRA